MQALDEQVFVGRERELASFRTWLEEDRGPSQILHVSGPGGVGKTALLRHFQYVAQQVGHRVVLITPTSCARPPRTFVAYWPSAAWLPETKLQTEIPR